MRLPFFRAKSPADEPARPARGKPPKGSDAAAGGGAAGLMADEGPVQAARTRARRRLIGAVVLLTVGVVGFPLLFETQPRPLPVNTPILVPEGLPLRPLPPQAARPAPAPPPDAGSESSTAGAASAPAAATAPLPTPAAAASTAMAKSRVAAASGSVAATPVPAPVPVPTQVLAPVPAAKPDPAKPDLARSEPAKPAAPADASTVASGRFVVQVGAYNDAERLRAARQKVEKLGFKTYTQDVDSPTGKRTRVRLGPFSTRAEAETAAAKVKASGLQANVLTL